jgi:hypothetical protein
MNREHFWLSDEQLGLLEPHLPTDTRGKTRGQRHHPCGEERRTLGRRSVGLWTAQDLYNRFQRWSAKGVWSAIFHVCAVQPILAVIDESAAHREACSPS